MKHLCTILRQLRPTITRTHAAQCMMAASGPTPWKVAKITTWDLDACRARWGKWSLPIDQLPCKMLVSTLTKGENIMPAAGRKYSAWTYICICIRTFLFGCWGGKQISRTVQMWQTPRMFGTSCVKCGSLLNGACEAEGYPGIQRKKTRLLQKNTMKQTQMKVWIRLNI